MKYFVEYSPNGNPADLVETWHETRESAEQHANELKEQGYKFVRWNDMDETE